MTLLDYFIICFQSLIEYCILVSFFNKISEKQKPKKLLIFLALLGYIPATALTAIYITNYIYFFTTYTIIIFAFSFIFDLSSSMRLFFSILLTILLYISQFLLWLFSSIFLSQTIEVHPESIIPCIFMILGTNLVFFIILKPIEYYMNTSESKISKRFFFALMSLPLSSLLVVCSVSHWIWPEPSLFYQAKERLPLFLFTFAVIALIAANVLIFYIYGNYQEQLTQKRKLQIVNQQINYKAQHFRELAEIRALSNQTLHDIKNKLFAISETVKTDPTEATKLINDLCEKTANTDRFASTGNDAIDALLSVKLKQMQKSNTNFKFNFFILPENYIDTIDLCVLLGNLLDNSIEACEKISANQTKEITLSVTQAGDYLNINISNTVSEKIVNKNGQIETTKADKQLHGFGLKSIIEIVKKYNGYYSFQQDNNLFSVIITLENRLQNK